MIEKLNNIDHLLFEVLNGSGPGFLDGFMRTASSTWVWLPVVALIVYLFIREDAKKGLLLVLFLALTFVLTDQVSVQVFKEGFQRLRPCHDPEMAEKVRLVASQCGGLFGFVSSHAANSFGIFLFSALIIRKKWLTYSLLAWAVVVSYSRIHVGVHYPGDVIGGAFLGLIIGIFTFVFSKKILKASYFNEQKD